MTDILSKMCSGFAVSAKKEPATASAIQRLERFSPVPLPSDYRDLVLSATEVEISVVGKTHLRIWGPDGCIEMNEAYSIQKFIPGSLAVGDDEGGRAVV